jgi:predicted enzyme related to lactoylglutathione lyase
LTYPNTLIFVDLASDDPSAAGKFYADVFGWTNEGRPEGIYHRLVPGEQFKNKDGSPSEIGNLHIGIFNANNARPYPTAEGPGAAPLSRGDRKARIWVMISDDDTPERILAAAEERGAKILWKNHYWSEFNGYNWAFEDPWGNEIILWGKAGAAPDVPADYTLE